MKNLKKVLSLVLALAMALSLMTVAFAADANDFADYDKVKHNEAVDVMVAAGVFNGVAGNKFAPNDTLTREQAAKIVTYMLVGQKQADKMVTTIAPYADVAANRWSAGSIAYCTSEGILAGTGGNKFNPTGKLTGLEFAKMLLVALGYDAQIEELEGASWAINTAKLAATIKLDTNLKDIPLNAVLTREQAAQMAFNAFKTPLVQYDSKGGNISINGADINIGATNAEYVTTTIAKEQTISDAQLSNSKEYTIEFGEKYCPKLVLKGGTDDFGRPNHTWTYDKKDIGSYIDSDLLMAEYTKEVTAKELYELLGASTLKNNKLTVYIDGVADDSINTNVFDSKVLSKTNKTVVGDTANGTLTQVFVDLDNEIITIAIINTYLAEADSDYNSKKDQLDLTVYGVDKDNKGNFVKTAGAKNSKNADVKADGEDFAVADAEEGDMYLVTVAAGALQSVAAPETVADVKLNSFKKGTSVKADGTTYEYSATTTYKTDVLDSYADNNMKDTTYKLYLDQYDYMIGIEIVEAEKNYVFIAGYETFKSVLDNAETEATAIFMDGTTERITVKDASTTLQKDGQTAWDGTDGDDQLNTWYTYTMDKNGKYSLTPVATSITGKVAQFQDKTSGKEINKSHISLKDNTKNIHAYGNDETVYLGAKVKTINSDDQITGVSTMATGVKNVNMKLSVDNSEPDGAYVLYNKDGFIIAAVVIGQNLAVSDNYAYFIGDVEQEDWDPETEEWTWHRDAIINGELVTLKEKSDNSKLNYINKSADAWYIVSYDADGFVMDSEKVTWDNSSSLNGDTDAVEYVANFNKTDAQGYDKEDVVLVKDVMDTTGTKQLTMKGHTMYVDTRGTHDFGLDIMPDAKAVLIQVIDDETVIEYYDETSGNVKAAIEDMDKTGYKGSVYAVMKDGVATAVIINDTEAQTSKPGVGPSTGAFKQVVLKTDGSIALRDKTGATVQLNGSYDYVLYMRGPAQENYGKAQSGTLTFNKGISSELAALINAQKGASFYVVVDGVPSAEVLIPNSSN